ncbi:MAG: toll/interleukin-1 receptor domain-containing protein [Muribaculaceae bacterium]|nr:toll/interleukin-1 receptor domain-containing protein [Muribaculaceae bacterium]
MDSTKYDVFISCKSEDYKYAEEVYDFLTKNHFNTFLASKELRKLGDSQYRESIEEALDTAEHIIVFSSDPEYPKSKYVKYEWGLFVDLKLDEQKNGNILTILKDMTPRELPIALRRYESFQFENYQDRLLDYVETEEHKDRIKKIQEKSRQEEQERLKKKEKEEERNNLLNQIKEDAETFVKKQYEIELEITKLRNLSKSIGVDKKYCRICNTKFDLEEEFCSVCGWKFHPLDGIEGVEYLIKNNPKQIELHKKLYAALHGEKRAANADESEKPIKETAASEASSEKELVSFTAEQILEKFIIQSRMQKAQYSTVDETFIQVYWDGLYDFIRNTLRYDISRTFIKQNIVEFWNFDFQPKWKIKWALKRVLSKYQFRNDIPKFSTNRNINWSRIRETDIRSDALIRYINETYEVSIKNLQFFSPATEKFVSIDQIADRIYEKASGHDIPLFPIKSNHVK